MITESGINSVDKPTPVYSVGPVHIVVPPVDIRNVMGFTDRIRRNNSGILPVNASLPVNARLIYLC